MTSANLTTAATRNLRDVALMELKFPQLRVVSPEDFLKQIES